MRSLLARWTPRVAVSWVVAVLAGTLAGQPGVSSAQPDKGKPRGLEFRVVASVNDADDKAQIEDEQKFYKDPKTAEARAKDLKEQAKTGTVPVAQGAAGGAKEVGPAKLTPEAAAAIAGLPAASFPDLFAAAFQASQPAKGALPPKGPGAVAGKHTYTWIELGDPELRNLNLDSAAERDAARNKMWQEAAKARSDGQPYVLAARGWLVFSRSTAEATDADRKRKGVEYFVLTHDPEADLVITEKNLKAPEKGERLLKFDDKNRPFVSIKLDKEGTDRLKKLTEKYKPDDKAKTSWHLAVVVNGRAAAAPRIGGAVEGGELQISGRNLSPEEARGIETALLPLLKP